MNKIEKLELRHLCGYPMNEATGLLIQTNKRKATRSGQKIGYYTGRMIGLSERTGVEIVFNPDYFAEYFDLNEIKPLLLPLSALDAQNLIDDLHGKMSDAIFDWIDYFDSDSENTDMAILCAPYPIIEWCFKNHFDIYGLITAGLAIDKRTIKTN